MTRSNAILQDIMFQRRPPGGQPRQGQFREMNATQLFCPTCNAAMPVREKLALYLPTGAIFHYLCARCDAVLGKKEEGGPRLG